MRRALIIALLLLADAGGLAGSPAAGAFAQSKGARALAQSVARALAQSKVVDRIVAIIEGDLITLSEVRELGAFNRLTGGNQLGDAEMLERLINQWIVTREAEGARFAGIDAEALERAYNELAAEFSSGEAYQARLQELGIDEAAVRRQLRRQLLLQGYLDQKYRFLVRIDDASIEAYYREVLAPQMQARGQQAPPLDEVRGQIRELLAQQAITRMAETWLKESRERLRIEIRREPTSGSAGFPACASSSQTELPLESAAPHQTGASPRPSALGLCSSISEQDHAAFLVLNFEFGILNPRAASSANFRGATPGGRR